MTRNGWILSLLSLLVVGCVAPVTYDHPSKSLAEKQRDSVECAATASQAAQGAGGWSSDRAIRGAIDDNARDQYLAICLESRGWVLGGTSASPSSTVVSAESPKDPERRCQQGGALYSGLL